MVLRIIILITLILYVHINANCSLLLAQTASDIQNYISKFKDIALVQEKQYGIPASITLAQGILESGAGLSALTRNTNNHFGIKAMGSWSGQVYYAWDDEAQKSKFRCYSKAEESFEDHSKLLVNGVRYRELFNKSVYDYRAWAMGLQEAGYATAVNYARALIGYIDAYKLYAINGGVKLKPGKTVIVSVSAARSEVPVESDYIMADDEQSEEEAAVVTIMNRFVVEINGVRCTILNSGQTLASIALQYDVPKSRILEFNEVSEESSIREGDIVFLQKKKKKFDGINDYYIVESGDTLYDISQKFGISLASLVKMNKVDFFATLREGQRLRLK